MKIREMTTEDFKAMEERSISHGIPLDKYPETIDYCYVLEHEGQILAIGGIRQINLATADCWLSLSEDAKKHIVRVYRIINEWLDRLVKEKNLRRLQAYIEPHFEEAIRLVEHLGFHRESVMQDCFPDDNAFMYVRLT